MRRAVLAGAAALAMAGPARAADFGIPIDVFAQEFNARARAMSAPVVAADPVCTDRTSCWSDLGKGMALLTGTAPDSDMVGLVEVVAPASPAGFVGFFDACDALVALVAPGLPEADRRQMLHAMDAEAMAHGAADRAPPEGARYAVALRDDGRLTFKASR